MNDLFLMLGIESWKPLLGSLLLPPVPLLLLMLGGAALIGRRRMLGWFTLFVGGAAIWLSASTAVGEGLQRTLLAPLPALAGEPLARLQQPDASRLAVAVVVLGGGAETLAPEYGRASLSALSLERLRYGIWLGRQLQAPVMFSGGVGHASLNSTSEAEIAAQIAAHEFARPLRWTETRSRDTRENARFAVDLLHKEAPKQLVLVTHGWHMPRALRAFRQASADAGAPWEVVAAPMGLAQGSEHTVLRWMPSSHGFMLNRAVLREKIGGWLGA